MAETISPVQERKLTGAEWEANFIQSISGKKTLSDKQRQILAKIRRKDSARNHCSYIRKYGFPHEIKIADSIASQNIFTIKQIELIEKLAEKIEDRMNFD